MPRRRGCDPAARGALEQTPLDEEGLVYVLDGLRRLAHGDGERREADGAAGEAVAHRVEDRPVELVEAQVVDLEQRQPIGRGLGSDDAVGADFGVVAHPLQQAVGDAGRASRPTSDFSPAVGMQRDVEDARRALDDRFELLDAVVVEPGDEAEAVAQWAGDQARARGGADQGERRDVEAYRPRRWALADHDVELAVFHRRVEHLFHRPAQAVDLVNKEDVAVLEIGEQRGDVARPLKCWTRRHPDTGLELVGDDPRQGSLAKPRRACQKEMVDGLAAAAGGLDEDVQVLAQRGLADELAEAARPEGDLLGFLLGTGSGGEQLASHRDVASSLRAWRSRSSTSPSDGSSANASRISSAS